MSAHACKVCEQSSGRISDFILCSGNCNQYLHYSCINADEAKRLRKMSTKNKKKWRCDDCRVQNRLNSPNTRCLDSGYENSQSSSTESIADSLDSRNSSQPNAKSELNALNQNLTETVESMKQWHIEDGKLALPVFDFEKLSLAQESNLNKVSKEVRDVNIMCCTKSNESECLEIHGLYFGVIQTQNAETFQKKIKEIIVEVGWCYGVQFSDEDINEVFILTTKIVQLPVLLVQFKSKEIRDRLLAVRKRKVSNVDLPNHAKQIRRFEHLRKRIYINESLCFCFKNLYDWTREIAKSRGFKFIWVKGGSLFVRKNSRSQKELITCLKDLHKLKAD